MTSTNATASPGTSRGVPGTRSAGAVAGPAGYGYEWARFADWCAATDRTPLPAHPITLAEFLDEHPAPAVTQRRRLAAITRAHTTHGHPSPAHAAAIRALLRPPVPADADAREALQTHRSTVAALVADLPTGGWPHGLFGRRDALVLVLTQFTDLTDAQISRLRRGDLHTDSTGQLHVTTGPYDTAVLPSGDDPRSCPGCVYRRWAWIGEITDRYPSVRTLRDALRRTSPVTDESPHRCITPSRADAVTAAAAPPPFDERLLLTPIDSWGYQPLHPTSLSAKAIAQLSAAHLQSSPSTHRTIPAPGLDVDDPATQVPDPPPPPRPSPAQQAARHTAALEHRRLANQRLAEASDALSGVDKSIQDLLERTLALLETAEIPARNPQRGGEVHPLR